MDVCPPSHPNVCESIVGNEKLCLLTCVHERLGVLAGCSLFGGRIEGGSLLPPPPPLPLEDESGECCSQILRPGGHMEYSQVRSPACGSLPLPQPAGYPTQ